GEGPRVLRQGDSLAAKVRDRLEQQGRRPRANEPVRDSEPLPHEGDEPTSDLRRGLAEPRRGPRPPRGERRSAAVRRTRAFDLSRRVRLEASNSEDVEFCARGGRGARLHALRRLEGGGDPSQELRISVSLEHLHEEGAPWAERSDGEGKGRLSEVERPGDVHGPVPAELRGHVAHDDVRGPPELLEKRRLDLRITEVTAQELDALQRDEGAEIHREHATGWPDSLPRDLRPSPRCGAQVDHDVARLEQADPTVDLGQLDRRPAAVRLLLRGPL